MNIIYSLLLGFLMIAIAVIVFDWGRIWWHLRHHGYIAADRTYPEYPKPPMKWGLSFLGYKTWTWVVRVFTWLAALWHIMLALSWFSDVLFELTT